MKAETRSTYSRLGALVASLALVGGFTSVDAAGVKADSDIPPASDLSGPSLAERLQKGGLVIYMRHERATREPVERFSTMPAPGCEASNTISRGGGERALAARAAIHQLKLPVGKVFSSAYCRTTETARLAFGVEPELTPMLESVHATATRGPEQMRQDALNLIARESAPGKNLVLVGHREGMQALTGIDVNTGDSLVLERTPSGVPRVLGVVTALRWAQLGADALRREAMAKGLTAKP